MSIRRLELENFKNIKKSEIEFKSNMSGIYGPNGTGKTSIIEAIEIVKNYFDISKEEKSGMIFRNNIDNKIRIGSNDMAIKMELKIAEYEYCICLDFEKTESGEIYISKEEIQYREYRVKNNLKYKQLAKIENSIKDLVPKFYLKDNTDYFNKLEEKILKKNKISSKELILKFNKYNSMLFLILNELEQEVEDSIMESTKAFIEHCKKINNVMKAMMVVTLEQQALYNLNIMIPIGICKDNIHGTFLLDYNQDENIYEEATAKVLLEVLNQIKPFLEIIVPESKLIIDYKPVSYGEENKIAINLYIEKNGKKVPIGNESTGIIKLFSIASALLYYVKEENAIVLIDELDIHIFEYLLSIILGELIQNAAGQLIFTGHNLLPLEKLNKDSIIISSKKEDELSYEYLKGVSNTTNLRNKYIKSQSMWSEENIEPLLINLSDLKMFIRKLRL